MKIVVFNFSFFFFAGITTLQFIESNETAQVLLLCFYFLYSYSLIFFFCLCCYFGIFRCYLFFYVYDFVNKCVCLEVRSVCLISELNKQLYLSPTRTPRHY